MKASGAAAMARLGAAAAAAMYAGAALAQLTYTPAANPSGINNSMSTQNTFGPTGAYYQQVNYPYPGQCLADPLNGAAASGGNNLFPMLSPCASDSGSFACTANGHSAQTAGGWKQCGGAPTKFVPLKKVVADSVANPNLKFQWNLLNPIDYLPDTTTYQNADYYELGIHEAWGFQALASAGLFPNPPVGPPVPEGMQWTGLVCTDANGCSCPNGAKDPFKSAYCSDPNGRVPTGNPLFTPIHGVGQLNGPGGLKGGPVTQVLQNWLGQCTVGGVLGTGSQALCWAAGPLTTLPACAGGEVCTALGLFQPGTASAWSANDYVSTWPSISIRGTKGRPVVVKWVNEFPNNHLFCPHPEAADWPCAIDRTFMGVKASIDPALGNGIVPTEGVNQFGSPQQPDNSWVTHLHGGEIPPSTDGFAEKWYGNAATAAAYSGLAKGYVTPPFENPLQIHLKRPAGNFDTYTYPMVNEEATIWFHDHTLGKTHHNVVAGPAGFFPVKEPLKHSKKTLGVCQPPPGHPDPTHACDYTWLDPVTEPRNFLGVPKYDLFLAIQDRAFNDDGSINFSNDLGQVVGAPTPVTPGDNPTLHPVWKPEYFGDHAVVNGVLWPKHPTEPGWYRMRIVDGSDSRCYVLGFQTTLPAPGTKPAPNLRFYVIANDQGYLAAPVLAAGNKLTICPGERYEILVDFSFVGNTSVYMTNEAAAPFPNGELPYDAVIGGVLVPATYPEMNVLMRFDVNSANGPGVKRCANGYPLTWDPNWTQAQMDQAIRGQMPPNAPRYAACMPASPTLNPRLDYLYAGLPRPALPATIDGWAPGTIVRQVFLNERVDGVTGAPMGMQLNGVPFEYKVTETPKEGSVEIWRLINLTVDAHPMHPHLVRHLVVGREKFNSRGYLTALCGNSGCSPGTAPGGEMQAIPDVEPFLTKPGWSMTQFAQDSGWKDATPAYPGQVTTIIAKWEARWTAAATPAQATAPGTAGCPTGAECVGSDANTWLYEPVTSGPYVWHCHINSHEDSEMMRTSLVIP